MLDSVFITGGSRGIGAALIREFAGAGCRVAFTYKNSEKAAQELSEETGAYPIYCDVADEGSVKAAIKKAHDVTGDIDVLINNAGISFHGLIIDMTADDWRRVLAANTDGIVFVTREVLPMMIIKGGGRIVNISSVWGVRGAANEAAYSTSKAAILGFTRSLAKEYSGANITVNAVAPGVIDTDMNRCFSDEERAQIIDDIPLGRMGTVSEVAKLVRFLCSEDAGYITGQVIGIDGGFSD